MITYEDALDEVTLLASQIVAREDTKDIVADLYTVIGVKCENGDFLDELNGIERIFYLCENFDVIMKQSGIEYYYKSRNGNYANEAVEALTTLGALQTASLLQKGNHFFCNGIVPEDRAMREQELLQNDQVEMTTALTDLDQAYQTCKEDVEALCLYYVLHNKEAFM